jgi:hypothetical protein
MRGITPIKTTAFAIAIMAMAGQMTSALAQHTNVFPNTNVWKYMATASDTSFCLNGTGWETAAYDDSSWPSAPGGFTGGETSAAALVGVTTTSLPAPTPSQGRPQYFRTHFSVGPVSGLSLILSNRIDDQAVFYLNDTRVADYRHPDDPETCIPGGAGGDEATVWVVITLTAQQLAGILHAGDNVLAVSVHQNATGSSDMVFVCQLWAETSSAVMITDSTGLSNRTVVACTTTTLSVGVSGSSPITFQWFKDTVAIDPAVNPTATNSSLVLSNLTLLDSGNYTVKVTNPLGMVTSSPATVVTVVEDTTPPTVASVLGLSDLTSFVVTFSEPMDPGTVNDTFGYVIQTVDGSESLTIDGFIIVSNATQIIITTSLTPRDPGKNYKLIVNPGGSSTILEACNPNNVVPADTTAPIAVELQVIPIGQIWKYLDDGTDPGPTWADVGFNDSGWQTGTAPFSDPIDESLPVPAVTPLTRGPGAGTTDYTTAFFRTHFSNPGSGSNARFNIRTTVDDGLILFLNGIEVFRSNVLAGVTRTDYGGGTAGDIGGVYQGPFEFDVTNLTGDNVLAAILYQANATSSDWAFGVEVTVVVTNVSSGPIMFVQQPQPLMINEGQTAAFSATVEGGQPITFQWQKDNVNIPDATNSSLTINNATPATNGQYRVIATNPASPSGVPSDAAQLTVTPDLTRPVLVTAAGSTNPTVVNLTFSKPISAATGGNTANYALVPIGGGGALVINSAVVSGSNIVLNTAARVFGTSYQLTITGLRDSTFTGNLINPNPTVVNPLQQDVLIFSWNASWNFFTNSCLDGQTWYASGYDASAWPSGTGLFGLEPSGNGTNVLAQLALAIQTPLNTNEFLAFYFRKSFDWNFGTAGVQFMLRHLIDDGAAVYVNGNLSALINQTNPPPLSCTNLSTGGAGEVTLLETNLTGVASGNNLIAVQVFQQSATSSDVVFGAELIARLTQFSAQGPRLTIAIEPSGTQARIQWNPVQGTLQFKNNLDDPTWTDVSPGGTSGNVVVDVNQLKRFYTVRQ